MKEAMRENSSRHWAEIGFTVLRPEERTTRLPEDTQQVPYYARLRGFVTGSCRIGQEVEVETLSGRRVRGEVIDVSPRFAHDFGKPVAELIEAGLEAKAFLRSLEACSEAAGPTPDSGPSDALDLEPGSVPHPGVGPVPGEEATR